MAQDSQAAGRGASGYDQWADIAFLFKSPSNMRRLLQAHERALAGQFYEYEVDLGPAADADANGDQGLKTRLVWTELAWEDYAFWRDADPAVFEQVNALLACALENPGVGPGDPVAHTHGATFGWTRHIEGDHRLAYIIEADEEMGTADLIVLQARYHQ